MSNNQISSGTVDALNNGTSPTHTPEPWEIEYDHNGSLAGTPGREWGIGQEDAPDSLSIAWGFNHRADAERAVACVNACEGLADPSALKELVEVAKALTARYNDKSLVATAGYDAIWALENALEKLGVSK